MDEQRFIAEARRILRDVDLGDISLRVTAAPAALGIPALEARITGPAGGPAGLDTLMGDGLRALDRVRGGATTLSPQERTGLEAIVRLEGRPALLVQEGDFMPPPRLWASLTTVRDAIKAVLARVGRIEVSGHPDFDWIGTGFLVARDIVMTNRHVAVEFARQSGAKWQFQAGRASSIDLREEFGSTETFEVSVKEVVGVHKTLDLALLKVEAASRDGRPLPDPLPLASSEPAGLAGRKVYAVGYPAWDGRRNDPEPMRRVFMDIYNVKRLQPGEVLGRDGDALQVLHDCSTLGGNSGSPIVDLDTHQVIGLHFGGRFLQNNFAVPLWLLTGDALIKRARLNFA